MVQAVHLQQKYFHSYDTYTLLLVHRNQKKQAINLRQKLFNDHGTNTLLMFH